MGHLLILLGVLGVLVVSALEVGAQPEEVLPPSPPQDLSVPDDPSVLELPAGNTAATSTPTPGATSTSEATITPTATSAPGDVSIPTTDGPQFGRTVVLVLGGVSWNEWLSLLRPGAPTPGFRNVLEKGALAAARLPGEPAARVADEEYFRDEVNNWRGASPALLRTAGVLSSGQAPARAGAVPLAAAVTLGLEEKWGSNALTWENAKPVVAYTRRTYEPNAGGEPQSGTLLNLGWGTLQNRNQGVHKDRYGILGSVVQRAGGRAVAFGSADTGKDAQRSLLLREWALLAADHNGVVAGGDVSGGLLTEDVSAPFNVRTNGGALLASCDQALRDPRTALIAIEWGDTRRAAMYAPLCTPEAAGVHKLNALTRADAWLQAFLPRLSQPRDRLLVIAVPDLQTSQPQWLPLAWWEPGRTGRGAFLKAGGAGMQPGIVPLESLTSLLVSRLPVASQSPDAGDLRLRNAYSLEERGAPMAATDRIGRLLALQSGLTWLNEARSDAHAVWASLLMLALGLSLVLLSGTPREEGKLPHSLDEDDAFRRLAAERRQGRAARITRGFWVAAMTVPLVFWLAGLCLEVTRRLNSLASGSATGADNTTGWNWTAPLALGAVAVMIILLALSARTWFDKVRLNRTRIGSIWLGLAVLGLWLGGFALPWNSLLGPSLLSAGSGLPSQAGDIWALLLISATLLAVAGLTKSRRADSTVVSSGFTSRGTGISSSPREDSILIARRRVINLRPAAIWMSAIIVLLLLAGWERDLNATLVALMACGVMWLRLWLERSLPSTRLSWRRRVLGGLMAVIVLLGWQSGGWVVVQDTLLSWWPAWLASWEAWWWSAAFIVTVISAIAAATFARPAMRSYLSAHYTSRLMLAAASVGGIVALVLFGPSGPPLLALYTLGAVFYEALGESAG